MGRAEVAVLIPAYKPDERMITLVNELMHLGFAHIVIVNDGSGSAYAPIFAKAEKLGACILIHEVNRGKGAALRTGIAHIAKNLSMSIITADADGQHSCEDIDRIASALEMSPNSLVLGMRTKSAMPLRSRAGNTLTAFLFGLLTGLWISDTQTGLRGLPRSSLESFLQLDGDRYEYEMNMLLYVRRLRIPIMEVPIETIYIDDNKGSHFHALRDGARIYILMFRQIFTFMSSSLISGLVDMGISSVLRLIFPELILLSIGVARGVSSVVNYLLNQRVVFRSERTIRSAVQYFLLVGCVLVADYYLIRLFKFLGVPLIIDKLMADLILFFINYNVQRSFIFRSVAKRRSAL